MMPGPALSGFILRQLPYPLWAPHPPPNFSSSCHPRHPERSDSIAPEIFLVESTGKARPTIEGRALCELGMWRRIGGVPSRT
jgi:hypothetical protein